MDAIRVLIMDDHPIFRRGIRWILESAGDITVIGEAENGQEAIELADRMTPDVVLVDVNLPGINGLEIARVIKRRDPRIRIVVLSVSEDEELLFNARSEEHTSELQSRQYLVCSLLLEKKNNRDLIASKELI